MTTKRSGMGRWWMGAVFAAAGLMPLDASALAVPALVTHQGRLFDAQGTPVVGPMDITFAIYDAEVAGNEIWSEIITVDFDQGFFSVRLGEQLVLDELVFDGSTRWLGITVGADPEMTPAPRSSASPTRCSPATSAARSTRSASTSRASAR